MKIKTNDSINRQAAIDAVLKVKIVDVDESLVECPDECNAMIDGAVEALEKLPSVQSEQKRGKWIESTELSEQVKGKRFCSNCGKAQYAIEITDNTIQIKSGTSKFCPECGARMEE